MFYAIRHVTRYRYSRPVWQSIMEVRMHPRTEPTQRCFTFQLSVNPRARIFAFVDHLGNQVHHFDLPAAPPRADHRRRLARQPRAVPDRCRASLPFEAWGELEQLIEDGRSLADADAEPVRAAEPAARASWRASSASTSRTAAIR